MGSLPAASCFSVRTVTAWSGTMSARSCVSVEMVAWPLMPGSAPGTGTVSAMRTGKVVTSASVPAFFTVAFLAISMTWAGNFRSGKASISISAASPSCRWTTSCSPTSTFISMLERVAMMTMGSSLKSEPRTRSPTCFRREVRMPSMGAVRVVKESRKRASARLALAFRMRSLADCTRAAAPSRSATIFSSSAALALSCLTSRCTRFTSASSLARLTSSTDRSERALCSMASRWCTWAS